MTEEDMQVIITAKEFVLRSINSCVSWPQLKCAGNIIKLFQRLYGRTLGKEQMRRMEVAMVDAFFSKELFLIKNLVP